MRETWIDKRASAAELAGSLILAVPGKVKEIAKILAEHVPGKKVRRNEFEKMIDDLVAEREAGAELLK